jgi:hypothetical protein
MSKAKVIAKLKKDGATYVEGKDHGGEYVFEAWLPDGKIWDNAHQVGMVYAPRDSYNSMSDLWADVEYITKHNVIDTPSTKI